MSLQRYLDAFGLSPSAYHKWENRDTLEVRNPVPKNMPRATPPEELSQALNTTLNYNFREELNSFLEKMQIEHYPNPYRQPEYNGKTERQNKNLKG